jgi:hypothetical protein
MLAKGEEKMSIKQDQYTVIDYTWHEAVAIKTKAGMGMNVFVKNTRLSATVSLTCWLPLTLKSSYKCSGYRGFFFFWLPLECALGCMTLCGTPSVKQGGHLPALTLAK